MTGGRLQRVLQYVGDEEFCFTYGDGVADVDIGALDRASTAQQGTLATVTAVQPPGRFGALEIDGRPRRAASRRSRTATAAGSTAASSCCRREVGRLPRGRRRRSGSASRWSGSRATASSRAYQHRLLAADGHAARQDVSSRSSGRPATRRGRRGRRRRPSGAAGGSSSPATPASRAAGSRCGCDALGADVTGYRAGVPTDAVAVRARARRRRASTSRRRRRPRPRGAGATRSRERGPRSCSTWPRSRSCARSYARAGRDVRDQRHGHRQRARGRAHAPTACAWSSTSRPTSATRTASGSGPTARTSRWAATTRTRSSKGCAELVTAAYRASFFGAGRRRRSRRRAPAT